MHLLLWSLPLFSLRFVQETIRFWITKTIIMAIVQIATTVHATVLLRLTNHALKMRGTALMHLFTIPIFSPVIRESAVLRSQQKRMCVQKSALTAIHVHLFARLNLEYRSVLSGLRLQQLVLVQR